MTKKKASRHVELCNCTSLDSSPFHVRILVFADLPSYSQPCRTDLWKVGVMTGTGDFKSQLINLWG